MNCPKCRTELHEKTIHEIAVHECPSCEGIWFEKDELRQVKDRTDADLNWMDVDLWQHRDRFNVAKESGQCPHCEDEVLHAITYGDTNVQVDYCNTCSGVWLDKGEMEKIIEALEEELLTQSTSEYLKETIQEAKELLKGKQGFLSEWRDFTTILRLLQYRILANHPLVRDSVVSFQASPINK
ncbi:hypothetical protein GF406_25085 [candidate division KSB1 bacterium]|nr:hypothetical protein [candidate division KSB1 bacterium]